MPDQILEQMSRVGEFADLSTGRTRYEVEGPDSGETVVLVHGLAGHMHMWDRNFHTIADAGFRALRYDVFGRGFSERVEVEHDSKLYVSQLKELLDHLDINGKCHLVGLSMGGAVVTHFAACHPQLVKSLTLVDAFGIPTPNDPLLRLIRPKYLGEALIGSVGGTFIKALSLRGVKNKGQHKHFPKWFTAPLSTQRSKRSVLSSIRNFLMEDHLTHYAQVEKMDIPKLIVWGEHDKVLDLEYGRDLHSHVPSARFEIFEDSGHIPHYEEPERFNQLVIDFMNDMH